jgi:hypothetical protein
MSIPAKESVVSLWKRRGMTLSDMSPDAQYEKVDYDFL